MITLWLQLSVGSNRTELLDAFQAAVEIARRGFPPTGVEARRRYRVILLRTLRDRLGPTHTAAILQRLATEDGTDEPDDLAALMEAILGSD